MRFEECDACHMDAENEVSGIKLLNANMRLTALHVLIHDTHAAIITIQETKLTPKASTPQLHNFTTVPIGCTRQEVGSLHSLETTLRSQQQTYLRQLIHRTLNGQGTH